MTSKQQLIEFIKCSPNLKEQLKKNYYTMKIKEAKDKKKELVDNKNSLWDLLPEDVQEKIQGHKEDYDIPYIHSCVKTHNLTNKALIGYLFNEYRNEDGEKLKRLMAVNHNMEKFLWIMINRKSWKKNYYKASVSNQKFIESVNLTVNHWKDITKNKAPSLFEYIEYRTNEKKEQSEKRKKENKERAKKEIKTDLKVGDLINDYNRYDCKAFIITGETKTQWRVESIDWMHTWRESMNQGQTDYYYQLDTREKYQTRRKHKNIGKKKYLVKFQDKDKLDNKYQIKIINIFD